MRLIFSMEDVKSPDRLERVLRQIERALSSPQSLMEAVATQGPTGGTLAQALAPAIRDELSAGGGSQLNATQLVGTQTTAVLVDSHAKRSQLYGPAKYSQGQLYYETDRHVLYEDLLVSNVFTWVYLTGTYIDTFANRPADLGTNDAGFRFIASDTEQHYRWDGAAWVDEMQTAFTFLRWGGITAAFPAIKRSATILQARLADDTGYTSFEVLDEAYSSSWNGKVEVPTKNAVYDKIETLVGTFTPLFDHFADVGNSTTVETDLYSDTTAAGQLATNGDKINAQYGGKFVTHATATRQLKVYFAGTAIFDSTALLVSVADSYWTVYVSLIRVSSSVVRYMISMESMNTPTVAFTSVGELTGLTLSGTNILKITGTAAAAGAATDDIVAKMGFVTYSKAA